MALTDTGTSPQKALLTVSPEAIAQLKVLRETEGIGKPGVRLGVKGGGCSGFSYLLEFDEIREGDNIMEVDGISFFMDRKSAIYLKGILLDYQSGLRGKGFQFKNPNASSTCGCGESFSV